MNQTSKIKIRNWKLKDLPDYEFWYDGKKKWMEFDGPYYAKPTITETMVAVASIKYRIKYKNWSVPQRRMVIAMQETDKMIGIVSWYWQSEETNWKSIGIVIFDDQYWNKGFGFDALKLWIDYLFKTAPQIVRLDLRTWSGNSGMINLAEKLGFKLEARFRNARVVDGKYFDSIGMGILREEWNYAATEK